jgi:hypothetical protein
MKEVVSLARGQLLEDSCVNVEDLTIEDTLALQEELAKEGILTQLCGDDRYGNCCFLMRVK